jgi:ATP-dependent RNA helicase RhlE
MDFTSFNLDPRIMEGVKVLKYDTPTPIQEQAIPIILQGRDLIGLAQTGTGKTAAFVLPVLNRLLNAPRQQLRTLIISPTRELAEQTVESINVFSYYTGLHAVSIYGGVSMFNQVEALKRGPEIVVACPGRLLDHLLNGTVDLTNLDVLIIDEADRMFDMGFLPDIRKIVSCITRSHQTLLFSATMPPDIRRLVQEVLHDPVIVQIGQSAPVDSVSHAIYPVKPNLKIQLLKEILKNTDTESVVIFTRTKYRVEHVADSLRRAGYAVAALQGDMLQNHRQAALDGFRYGDVKILVATDIAARGLDILSITHVINFDMPDTTDAYIHRIGRTGRVNNKGDAFTLVTPEDRGMIKALEKIFKKPIEVRRMENFAYDESEESRVRSPRSAQSRPPTRGRPEYRNNQNKAAPGREEKRAESAPAPAGQSPDVRPPSTHQRGSKPATPRSVPSGNTNTAQPGAVRRPVSNRRPPLNAGSERRQGPRRPSGQKRQSAYNQVSRVRFASPESITRAQ